LIKDCRINGEGFYLIEKESKVCMHPRNIAALSTWMRSQIETSSLLNFLGGKIKPQ